MTPKGRTPAPSPGRVCRFCGTDIAVLRSGATVCRSAPCRVARKTEWQKLRRPQRVCRACAATIPRGSKRFYCGDTCYRLYRRDYLRERMRTPVMRTYARVRYLTVTRPRLSADATYRNDVRDRHRELSIAYYRRHRDDPEFLEQRRNYTRQQRRVRRLGQLMEDLRDRSDKN